MTRTLVLPVLFLACATSRQPAVPTQAEPAEPGPSELRSAIGRYFSPGDGRGHLLVLHEHHGTWWLLADRHLLSVQVEQRGPDFVVRPTAPPSATGEETEDEKLPREFVFRPGSSYEPRWRYEAGAWTGQQFLDPVAARVVRRGESVRLVARSEHEERARTVFQRCVTALRAPTPERLRELTRDFDPQAIAEAGGAERLIANQLANLLGEVEERVPVSERAWIARHRDRLDHATAGHPALWPASEDAKLLALVSARYRSSHVIEISDGWLMKLDLRDETRGRCQAGWAFPDPTGNTARERHTARAAEPGKVSRLFYGFFHMPDTSGEDTDKSCQFRPVPGHTYAYESGFPFYLFVDADHRIVGAQLVGYMYVELFVVPGTPDALLRAMLEANREEIGRQAE
jgi:hypothetical protein